MQADGNFAAALRAGDAVAIESTGLDAAGVELVTGADPAGVAADFDGRRRAQIYGNSASEHTLTLAAASLRADGAALFDGFLASGEFHAAIADDGRLPLAFAEFAGRRIEEFGAVELAPLHTLESAMLRLRRDALRTVDAAPLEANSVRLSTRARIVDVPAGTIAWAGALRDALDHGRPVSPSDASPPGTSESVLLHAQLHASAYRLPEVSVELLRSPADRFLRRAERAITRDERAAFAAEHDASAQAFETFLDGFVAEGVLERGA